MNSSRTKILTAVLTIAVLTSVCNIPTFAPSAPSSGEVIIPPTTKVMDAAALTALESVRTDGTLTFSTSSPALEGLAPADVVVMESTSAAPNGLLRKVISVRTEGDKVIVETEGAKITEAIHQGSLSITQELKPEDIRATTIFQPGVTFDGATVAQAPGPRDILASYPLRPGSRATGLTYSFDTDLGTGGKLKLAGNAVLTPILKTDMSISCDRKVLGICAEIPDLNFMASVGVEETVSLTAKGNTGTFDKEARIARHEFNPITFSIGPVPVVIVPIIDVYLHGNGTLTATLDYSVNQNLKLVAGFKYNSDKGFEDISEKSSNFSLPSPSFNGNADVRGALGVKFELLFYGVVGPFGSLEAGPHISASISGLPPDANTLWRIEGCLWLNIGIDSVDVLDIHYQKELYKACLGYGTGENHPPLVNIDSPNPSTQIFVGVPVNLRGSAVDTDGGAVTCQWTSSTSGDPFPRTDCKKETVTFQSQGDRTLTLTGTDPGGKSTTRSVTINVLPPPAILVTISSPADGATIGPDEQITLSGSASGGTGPYSFAWKVVYPVDASGGGGSTYDIAQGDSLTWKPSDTLSFPGCEVDNFARIILETTDANGFTGSLTIFVHINRIC